ncbi:hypothetical protein J5N97_020985 [Dioscorea zingiberensis]|uniref:ApaG domain-containing protein n=1 Tax=Dioscorea zingiberensis TaxID=325984 RepID=A0A9D5CGT0_9LILI|nr:hypothetical protein J5N97_020985 [Dioscorea zingiberensis]
MEQPGMDGSIVLEMILEKLEPRDVAAVVCVSPRMRACASDDSLWRRFCARDFGVSSPVGPDGEPCPSFIVTYRLWIESFGMYPLALVKRTKQLWDGIRSWLAVNFPEAKDTLRKGVSEAELNRVEELLVLKLPMATRLLYRFCEGQKTQAQDVSTHKRLAPLGLIGGYQFYDHVVNVHLLPLNRVVEDTLDFVRLPGFPDNAKRIVVAASYYYEKWYFLDCGDGQLYVGTRNVSVNAETIPCVPQALIRPWVDANCDVVQDGFLLWLEEHFRRLQSGMIRVRKFMDSRAINLYPELPPSCSVAITNGVKVRASALLIPELSGFEGGAEKYYFSYSIRMSLQPRGCLLDGRYYESCQLYSRHWIIRSKDVVVGNVNARAVIGKYPRLFPNEEEFVYESCTPLPEEPGSIEGAFKFVPGRLEMPDARQFDVQVARFKLEVPEYVF